jgi:hypothetical protein
MSATSHAVANGSRRRWLYCLVLLASLVAATFSLPSYLQERALHALPYGFKKFSISDPLPACARWKDHMPSSRDPAAYQLYIEARKVWRSKIDAERERRYDAIYNTLQINPNLKRSSARPSTSVASSPTTELVRCG